MHQSRACSADLQKAMGHKVKKTSFDFARPILLALLTPLVIGASLTGCTPSGDDGKQPTSTSTNTSTGTGKQPVSGTEETFATEAEIAKYVEAQPDSKFTFPETEFSEARPYIFNQNKPAIGEKILKEKLEDAVKSQAGQTKLGQYCVRLGVSLWNQGPSKQKEAMKYFLLAQRIFYKQPQEKRPMPNWFFNAHMHPGLYYNGERKFALAETEWRKCVNISAGAPLKLIPKEWRKISLQQLSIALKGQGKTEQAKQVDEQAKKI
ncbi:MAG: hypothetical protein SFV17_09085 [Candidatus Obscuribacter sp.]|nr:hypothetical protein [Candidatus Obscuribacter sp.]